MGLRYTITHKDLIRLIRYNAARSPEYRKQVIAYTFLFCVAILVLTLIIMRKVAEPSLLTELCVCAPVTAAAILFYLKHAARRFSLKIESVYNESVQDISIGDIELTFDDEKLVYTNLSAGVRIVSRLDNILKIESCMDFYGIQIYPSRIFLPYSAFENEGKREGFREELEKRIQAFSSDRINEPAAPPGIGLRFTVKDEEFIDELYDSHVSSNAFKERLLLSSILIGIIGAALSFALFIDSIKPSGALLATLLIALAAVFFFRRYTRWRVLHRLKQQYRSVLPNGARGETMLYIDGEKLIQRNTAAGRTIESRISNITKIKPGKYFYHIVLGTLIDFLTPYSAFKNDGQGEAFMATLAAGMRPAPILKQGQPPPTSAP